MARKTVIQSHHITYQPERVVKLYKGEHWLATQLNRRRKISEGWIEFLDWWLEENRGKAVKL
jgi:hypothetical protein